MTAWSDGVDEVRKRLEKFGPKPKVKEVIISFIP